MVDGPARASYAFLEADASGYQVEFRRVEYDRDAAMEEVRRLHHPSGDFIVDWLAARRSPWWAPSPEDC
jgi:hypothetical protein